MLPSTTRPVVPNSSSGPLSPIPAAGIVIILVLLATVLTESGMLPGVVLAVLGGAAGIGVKTVRALRGEAA